MSRWLDEHWHTTASSARFVGVGRGPDGLWIVSFWWRVFSFRALRETP